MKILLPLLVCICALLSACVTGEKMHNLTVGMTVQDVQQILGKPEGVRTIGNQSVWTYSNKLTSGWSWDRADYNVVFENGSVIEYGAGQVRPGPRPNTVIIIPLRP